MSIIGAGGAFGEMAALGAMTTAISSKKKKKRKTKKRKTKKRTTKKK